MVNIGTQTPPKTSLQTPKACPLPFQPTSSLLLSIAAGLTDLGRHAVATGQQLSFVLNPTSPISPSLDSSRVVGFKSGAVALLLPSLLLSELGASLTTSSKSCRRSAPPQKPTISLPGPVGPCMEELYSQVLLKVSDHLLPRRLFWHAGGGERERGPVGNELPSTGPTWANTYSFKFRTSIRIRIP